MFCVECGKEWPLDELRGGVCPECYLKKNVLATGREMELAEKRAIRTLASRFIERVVTDGDRNAFVLRDEDVETGLDVYMGTTNSGRMLAKAIANEYGGRIAEHHKIVGQKDGLDLVRMTFAVRLPEYRAGDIVVLDHGPGI